MSNTTTVITLTPEESAILYRHLLASTCPKDIHLQLLFETGCRVSEALHLTPSNLRPPSSIHISPLKNSSPRIVTLSPNLKAKLLTLPPVWRRAIGEGGRHSQRRALCRHFHALSLKLLGRRINLHALRHSAMSRLYVATKDLILVKNWAGHKSINSTLTYVHLDNLAKANDTAQHLLSSLEG